MSQRGYADLEERRGRHPGKTPRFLIHYANGQRVPSFEPTRDRVVEDLAAEIESEMVLAIEEL